MSDAKCREARRTRRMLYAFALVLLVAVVCALVLLIASSAAYALSSAAAAPDDSGITAVALATFIASLGAAFTMLRRA